MSGCSFFFWHLSCSWFTLHGSLFKASKKWVQVLGKMNLFWFFVLFQRQHTRMRKFWIYYIIITVICLLKLVYVIAFLVKTKSEMTVRSKIQLFVFSVTWLVFDIYMFICINSIYEKMKKKPLPTYIKKGQQIVLMQNACNDDLQKQQKMSPPTFL